MDFGVEHWLIKQSARFGWVIARKSTVNKDGETLYTMGRIDGIKAGKEIGILNVLRYNQQTLSPAKFKESARHFDFEALDAKYPFNPLLEKPYEKSQATTRSIQGISEENESP